MLKRYFLHLFFSIFLGFGVVFSSIPLFLIFWIRADTERYIWIIRGPSPFSHMGSAPFQLLVYFSLVFMGLLFLVIGFFGIHSLIRGNRRIELNLK